MQKQGANLVGFADVGALPQSARKGFPRAVCLGVALTPGVAARIPTGPHQDYDDEYQHRNAQLDALGRFLEEWLAQRGFEAYSVSRARTTFGPENDFTSFLQHKTVARLAGLGWVGKGAVLVTPQYGTAVRLVSVLTNAPFETGQPLKGRSCGTCTACQQACPAGAIHGVSWRPGVPRSHLVNAASCDATMEKRRTGTDIQRAACGLCLAACPFTKAYLQRAGAL